MRKVLLVLFLSLLPLTAKADLYVVRRGDSLYKIAKKFKTSVRTIKRLNGLRRNMLKPGQRLIVPGRSRFAKPKKSLATISLLEKKAIDIKSDYSPAKVFETFDSNDMNVISDTVESEAEALSDIISTPVGVSYDNWNLSILNLPEYKSSFLKMLANILKKYKNTPYVFGYNNPARGLDCSSFTMRVYRNLGINLPRTARAQYNTGISVPKSSIKVGDLVFFRTYARFPSHVGIYIGDGKFVHFSSMYHGLAISSLSNRYFRRRFIGAKRVLSEKLLREVVAKIETDYN